MAVRAEDGCHAFRRLGRKVEVSAEEEAGSCFQSDVFDGVTGVTAPGVASGVERRPAGQWMEAGAFKDSLPDCSTAFIPGFKVRDLLGDPVEFGLALVRLEISSPAQGGLVLGVGERAKADGADQDGQWAGHVLILAGDRSSGREKQIRAGVKPGEG